MSGYSQAGAYWEKGWFPLPLPHGAKTPPPTGTTGRTAPLPERSDVEAWMASTPDGNIAVRLPETVIGVDVDAYKDESVATMRELSALAPMPATWRSTSRDDGASGIYFYRVPAGVQGHLHDPGPGVETIRHNHRYAVVAPSTHPSGAVYAWFGPDGQPSEAPRVEDLPALPDAWLERMTKKVERSVDFDVRGDDTAKPSEAGSYERAAVQGVVDRLDAMAAAATGNPAHYAGEPWDATTFYAASRLLEIANASWSALTREQAAELVMAHAPRDAGFGDDRVAEKIRSAARTVGDKAAPAPSGQVGTVGLGDLWKGAAVSAPAPAGRSAVATARVDVSSKALAAEWLREEVGRGPLSGVFYRKGEMVYTPRVGEDGYIAPRDAVAEGGASLNVMTEHELQARIQHRYDVVAMRLDAEATKKARKVDPDAPEVWNPKPALFPLESAKIVVRAADDAPNLRELRGVVHAPTLRPDGSLITTPGYDAATGLLFLPTGGQPGAIPDAPSTAHIELARNWIDYMLQDFGFVTASDRATYIGLMLTPLLRTLVPPPYKLGVIEAHQPGSGKTFLARALTSIHGGVLHSEMPPSEEELAKVVGALLDTQTAPVVVFDNVTGMVRSSTLAGLLTSPTFQGRRLGSSTVIEAENDRMWVITGNNAMLGGDLARRSLHVRIDPRVPQPHLRTGFAISGFESWVREHRGDLLWSLLVLTRAWVVQGMPFIHEPSEDSYGRLTATVRSILAVAGVPGTFDDPALAQDVVEPEVEEWETFLAAIVERFGTKPWTAKELLALVAHPAAVLVTDAAKPIPFDVLPESVVAGHAGSLEPARLATKLGRHLVNRRGRWYGRFSVQAYSQRGPVRLWRVEIYGQ